MRPVCQATQVAEFLVARGIVKPHWSDLLDELHERKNNLPVDQITDRSVREWVKTHSDPLDLESAKHAVDLLKLGEDGKAKRWWFLGGGFASPVVNAWIDFLSFYESHRLDLVELAVTLRRTIVDMSASSKRLAEKKLMLVEIHDKQTANDVIIHKLETERSALEAYLGVENSDTDVGEKIRAYYAAKDMEIRDELRSSCEAIEGAVKEYNSKFPSSFRLDGWSNGDPFAIRLVVDEVHTFWRCKDAYSQTTQLLSKCLEVTTRILSRDPREAVERDSKELNRLRNACTDNKIRQKLRSREESCRKDISELESQLLTFMKNRDALVKVIKNDLGSLFPNTGVDVVVPVD